MFTVAWVIISVVLLATLIGLFSIKVAISNSQWSLADALSEEIEITALDEHEQPKFENGKPMMYTTKCASASRLIALMGMIVILLIFFGFGLSAIFRFTDTGKMPEGIMDILKFLGGGMTLFAPYVINKFSGIFESFIPKAGQTPATTH